MQVYIVCVNWRGRTENWPSLLRIITVGECIHMRQVLSVIRGMNKFVVYVCLGYVPVAHFCTEYYNNVALSKLTRGRGTYREAHHTCGVMPLQILTTV